MNWADTGEEAGKIKSGDDPQAEQEAQTERMFKNTFRNFNDKSIEPSMFNANTIDFHYSLGEFFNRLTDPIFFYRVEISENWDLNPTTRDYWLDDGSELTNPKLTFAHASNHIQIGGCSGYVGSPGTYTPSQDTEIEFVLDKSNTGNRQVASCKAGVSYQVRVEQVGNELQVFFKSREEKITYETKINKNPNDIKNEIDQEALENE
ncbi:11077_t:CDS:2, partial [Ambispora leptoticha]